MPDVTVSIFNDSTLLTDEEVQRVAGALQRQVSEHFAPAWGLGATLTFAPKGKRPAPGTWWLAVLDTADQAGALGYHDATAEGLPMGKVFAKTDLDNHLSWSVTLSHELLEMLVDPDLNLTSFVQDTAKTGKLYAYEVCDPVEDDQFGYAIDGVSVSNFVLPAYFQGRSAAKGARLDFGGHLTGAAPTLLSGGHIGEFDVGRATGWTQLTAATEGQPHRGHLRIPVPGGRTERRRRPRQEWTMSGERLVPM
jgi:hypothetical protein